MNSVIVGLGSNVNPQTHIAVAREQLKRYFQVLKESSFKMTPAVGSPKQADYLNGAVLLKTKLDRKNFLAKLKALEKDLGEFPGDPDRPRVIDLDILVWNGKVIHPDVENRAFLRDFLKELK